MPAKDVLRDPETHAAALLSWVVSEYGTEALNWDPDTLTEQLREDVPGIPARNITKVQALIAGMTSNWFYLDPVAFHQLASAINGHGAGFARSSRELDVDDAAWAVAQLSMVDPPESDDRFSADTSHAVGLLIKNAGMVNPPPFLSFAQMPGRARPVDQATEQAVLTRSTSVIEDLQEEMRHRMRQLENQLQDLFGKPGPGENGDKEPEGYIARALRRARA